MGTHGILPTSFGARDPDESFPNPKMSNIQLKMSNPKMSSEVQSERQLKKCNIVAILILYITVKT